MINNKLVLTFLLLTLFLVGCSHESEYVEVNLPINLPITQPVTQPDDESPVDDITNVPTEAPQDDILVKEAVKPIKVEIPVKLELDVDFAPQAPFANWNELNEEACEEASMAIVAKYFYGEKLDEAVMNKEILDLDRWEKQNGYAIDLSADQVSAILQKYYKLNARVVSEVTVDRIKYELSIGNLIIVPLAGRALENPYFRAPGPIYHMLVIKGYDRDEFITNEVGTKRGDGFRYKYDKLINAIHDWDPSWSHTEVTDAQMMSQPKLMVVVSK